MGLWDKIKEEVTKPRPKFKRGDEVKHRLTKRTFIVIGSSLVEGTFKYKLANGSGKEFIMDEVMLESVQSQRYGISP